MCKYRRLQHPAESGRAHCRGPDRRERRGEKARCGAWLSQRQRVNKTRQIERRQIPKTNTNEDVLCAMCSGVRSGQTTKYSHEKERSGQYRTPCPAQPVKIVPRGGGWARMPLSTGTRAIDEARGNRLSQRRQLGGDCPSGSHPTGCHGVLGLRGGLGRCAMRADPAIEPYAISLVPPTSVDGYHGLVTFQAFSWLQRMSVGTAQRFSRSRLAPGESGSMPFMDTRASRAGKWTLEPPPVAVAMLRRGSGPASGGVQRCGEISRPRFGCCMPSDDSVKVRCIAAGASARGHVRHENFVSAVHVRTSPDPCRAQHCGHGAQA